MKRIYLMIFGNPVITTQDGAKLLEKELRKYANLLKNIDVTKSADIRDVADYIHNILELDKIDYF